MSLTYSLEDDALIYVIGSQTVTMRDRRLLVEQLLSDDSLPMCANVIINVSRVLNSPDTNEVPFIPVLISRLQSRFASAKIAIVNDRVGHATVSQIVAMLSEGGVRAFLSEAVARRWIGC